MTLFLNRVYRLCHFQLMLKFFAHFRWRKGYSRLLICQANLFLRMDLVHGNVLFQIAQLAIVLILKDVKLSITILHNWRWVYLFYAHMF